MNLHVIRFLIPVLFCFSCSAQNDDNNYEQDQSEWTKPAIEGQWKFVSAVKVEDTPFLSQYPNPHTPAREEGPTEPPYIGPDLIFKNDTMYVINYPTFLMYRNAYSLDSGYLHDHYERHTDSHPVELVNDTLFIYKPYYDKQYIKEGYVKTSFNDSILDILFTDEVNYPGLAGTWFLIRESSGEDGTFYELDFPYNVPDSIEITREDFISGLEHNKVYLMSTNGKKRDYFFEFSWGYLYLVPGDWYKGDTNSLRFVSVE